MEQYQYELICDDEVTAQKLAKELCKAGCLSTVIKAQGYSVNISAKDLKAESQYIVKAIGDNLFDDRGHFKEIYKNIRKENPNNRFPIDWYATPVQYDCLLPDELE